MKKIATVALQALESADKALYAPDWVENYRDLYKSWVEFRRQSGNFTKSMNEWRDSVSSHYKSLIEHYKSGKADRSMWIESMNLRASITVMGGFRDYRQWEVDVAVMVIDHSNKTKVYTA